MIISRGSIAGALMLAVAVFPMSVAPPAHAEVLTVGELREVSVCFKRSDAGRSGRYEVTNGSRLWQSSGVGFILDGMGCIEDLIDPASLALAGDASISVRVVVPRSRQGGKWIPAKSTLAGNYNVWPDPQSQQEPVPHPAAFKDRYGKSVATIVCRNPHNGRGSLGTGVAVPVTLSPQAVQYGQTYLATAAHVIRDCNYDWGTWAWKNVEVVYQGQSYPGRVWWGGYNHPHDIASIVTTAPVPPAVLAVNRAPQFESTAVAIGSATGVSSTVTVGKVVGADRVFLNLTNQGGPGMSGGPVFNNRGEVIGLVVAGSGSLTVAQSLPTLCDTVYSNSWSGCSAWPGL